MSVLRRDPIVNRWVIIAPNRAARPQEFIAPPKRRDDQRCPFCEGHEDQTPPEVFAYRRPGSLADRPGWRVRVVTNLYPALAPDARTAAAVDQCAGDLLPGLGRHEVVIESPRHVAFTRDLSEEEICEVLRAYRERLGDLKRDQRLAHGIIFKNVGPAAGASIEHVHSQIMATAAVLPRVAEELSGALTYYRAYNECPWCAMVRRERAAEVRIVRDAPDVAAFCPFASRVPYETRIVPAQHASHYEQSGPALRGVAAALKDVLARIEAVVQPPAYNYFVHTAPFDTSPLEHYHWHIEVIPSLTKMAGFEWGSGLHINPLAPEEAARRLREAV